MSDTVDKSTMTRQESRRQDRHDAIVTVASRCFLENGYAGTTMSAVAAAVGGSKATLWNYFRSKEELFAAVIDHETTAFRAQLSSLLNPCDSLSDSLRRFCTRHLTKVTTPGAVALNRLVVAESGRFPEMGQIFYARAPRLTHELLGAFLEGAMDRGTLQRCDPITAARQLIALCMSGSHHLLLVGMIEEVSESQIVKDVDNALDLFLGRYRIDG